ncbi:hypothetical protein CXY01_32580 [Cellulomonas xylanilytica]|uniref:Pyrrolo-quinoline quinone repeat domain-containing protein n=2 Tax=Cellulomonas xylanilytica TaxID=233583 RepID=A0A510V792_9CELL|nr:hypothetical protein CXY01_32580 [Cellulomonas xylanilytica]
MAAVELVERDETPEPPPEQERRPWSRRWLLVAAGTVAALVGTQAVVEMRERAAVAELARVPGVVRPVDEDVRILWTRDAGGSELWPGAAGDGALVSLQRASDGAQALVAVDELTGDRRWTTPLADAHVDHADEGFSPVGGCVPEPGDGGRVMCLVTNAYLAFRESENVLVPSDVSRIVVADLADGSVLAEQEAPGAVAFTALPGAVAVAVPRADGALVVTSTDVLTGQERWRTVVPADGDEPGEGGFVDRSTALLRTVDGPALVTAGRRITLLDGSDGAVRSRIDASDGFTQDARRGVVAAFSSDAEGRVTTTLLGDGPDLVLPGRLARFSADDGSLADLVLAVGSRLRAYDRSTGRELWDVGHGLSGAALVVRGRVYVSTPDGVVAVDGRTGEELWRAPVREGRTMGDLVTDGRHVLSAQQRPDEPGTVSVLNDWPGVGELVAYRFDDGREDWRVDLPGTLTGVDSVGHSLVGWGSGAAVLG